MSEQLPSLVTLCGFLLPAIILLLRQRQWSAGHIAQTLLIALFCMFGGLLFAAVAIKISGGIPWPLVSSALVVVGALLALLLQQWWIGRRS